MMSFSATFDEHLFVDDGRWSGKSDVLMGTSNGVSVRVSTVSNIGGVTINTGQFLVTINDFISNHLYTLLTYSVTHDVDLHRCLTFLDRKFLLVSTVDMSKHSAGKCVYGNKYLYEIDSIVDFSNGTSHKILVVIDLAHDTMWHTVSVSCNNCVIKYYVHCREIVDVPIYIFI